MTRTKRGASASVLVNADRRYNFWMKSHSDALYKQQIAHPEMVRDLLVGFLSADWVRALEVGAFERVNGSYTSERGKQRQQGSVDLAG